MKTITPPPLQSGNMIGIFAPSGRVERDWVERGIAALQGLGFRVKVHPQTFATLHQSAGTEKQKIAALHELWADPEVKAVIAARGLNRAGWMLEGIDYDLIRVHPKIYMGYSDSTALLLALNAKAGLVTYHGHVLKNFSKDMPDDQRDQCFDVLAGRATDLPLTGAKILHTVNAEGRLIGGNMSVLTALIGTPYLPDLTDAILFLEDVGEETSRIDRMFQQLRNAGILKSIKGLILGGFTHMTDTGSVPYGFLMEEIFAHATAELDIPIVTNAPFGHGDMLFTYPVGAMVRLSVSEGSATLRLA